MADRALIEQLQKQIHALQDKQGAAEASLPQLGLGELEQAFPGKLFPRAAVHELISYSPEGAASTSAFISVVLSKFMGPTGTCVWIGTQRKIFPVALKNFGVEPGRLLFVDVSKPKEAIWAVEEALKCDALCAVVGELSELSFNESRRLQLAVERSRVAGFIHRHCPRAENAVACVSRWKISPLASDSLQGMPGLGYPKWNVQLLKVRNGRPGEWQVQWSPKGLEYLSTEKVISLPLYERSAG